MRREPDRQRCPGRRRRHEQVLGELREAVGLLRRRAQRFPQLLARARPPQRRARARSCRIASGVRSSWLASATKRRSCAKAASIRASISFSVSPSRAISSRVGGTGSRCSSARAAEIAAALRRIASTGRSAAAASA